MRRLLVILLAAVTSTALLCSTAPAQARARAATPYHVVLKIHAQGPLVGDRVRIHGTVSGGPVRGRSVVVQYAYGEGSWQRFGTAPLGADGRWHLRFAPPSAGGYAFRAIMRRVGTHARGTSGADWFTAYQWRGLWRLPSTVTDGPAGATVSHGPVTMAGHTYTNALVMNDGTHASFDTRECIGVRGLLGIRDGSPVTSGQLGFQNEASLFGPYVVDVATQPYALDAGVAFDDGVYFDAEIGSTDGSVGGTTSAVVLARPQALCDFPF